MLNYLPIEEKGKKSYLESETLILTRRKTAQNNSNVKIPECYKLLKKWGEAIGFFPIPFILSSQESKSINTLKC